MNVTPNSFSDGGELLTSDAFLRKLNEFSSCDAIDIGAESTAPMNVSISWKEEWERLRLVLPLLKGYLGAISIDTYHPETIEEVLKFFYDHSLENELIWNDVSGKYDDFVWDYLSFSLKFHYVFCHNLAPSRDLTGRHMDYVDQNPSLEKLVSYFENKKHPQVIFDPCLGFSKTYEFNWEILNRFDELQKRVRHTRWLIGFSRKSFLRKKFNLDVSDRDKLDAVHADVLSRMQFQQDGELWVRTHRPDLIKPLQP